MLSQRIIICSWERKRERRKLLRKKGIETRGLEAK